MKKVFIGVTYILLLVIMFAYMLIPCVHGSYEGSSEAILSAVSFTGMSVIGFLFIIPAFVFTIINLCGTKAITKFIRDMMSLFSTVFILASVVIALTKGCVTYYAPVILTLCAVILFVLSLLGVIHGIKNEEELKQQETQSYQPVQQAQVVREKPVVQNTAKDIPEPVMPAPIEVKNDEIDQL